MEKSKSLYTECSITNVSNAEEHDSNFKTNKFRNGTWDRNPLIRSKVRDVPL